MKKIFFLIFIFLMINSCGLNMSAGSYPYAEIYTIDLPEKELVELIKQFEINNPEYKVPEVTIDGNNYFNLEDGRSGKDDYWFHFYLYYAKENSIVHIWTRPLSNSKTSIAFVGINEGVTLGHWKLINRDFEKSDNQEEIEKFEGRILNNIKWKK